MATRTFKWCYYCGLSVDVDPDYPPDAMVVCADCVLARVSVAIVDLDAQLIHRESNAIRNTTACGSVILGPFIRHTVAPFDMLPGDLCKWCFEDD